jgi:hypothetical protein
MSMHNGCKENLDDDDEEEIDEKMLTKIFNQIRVATWDLYKKYRMEYYEIEEEDEDQPKWIKAEMNVTMNVLEELDDLD